MRIAMALVVLLLPLSPLSAVAADGHMDVIQVTLDPKCSLAEYVKIKDDFNASWGDQNGYRAEVVVPIQSEDLQSVFWVGRTADAAAYGKAWDNWRDETANPKSIAGKLQKRFNKCSTNTSRRGYDVH